jgi:hypothetical protein
MKKKLRGSKRKEEIFICDTPGFKDSRGCENDISNQFATVNALYEAKSVRMVVIFPI